MGTSRSAPNEWLGKDGNGKTSDNNVFAGPMGWYIKHPNGQVELLQAMGGTAEIPVNAPDVYQALNPVAGDYSISAGDTLIFVINWSEPVIITGTPQIAFNENGVGQTADYVAGSSTSTQSVFEYDVAAEGAVDTVVTTISLNGGTIVGADKTPATATISFTETDKVDTIDVVNGGSDYDGTETIAIDAPSKANVTATITTTAEDPGAVLTVELEDGGYGYADGTIAITGGGADATVDILTTDGVITSVVLNAAGTVYTGASGVELAAPTLTVTQATATLVLTDTAVSSITVTEIGYGYDGTEGFVIDEPVGTDAVLTFDAGYTQPTGVTVVA